jgi:phosphoribosylanthranilate isomerase
MSQTGTIAMRVKICGITRVVDALDAVETGASAVGFIFVRSSPRYISPARALTIVKELPSGVPAVGVVADLQREEIMRLLDEAGVNALQFHGNETPEELSGFPVPVYKAFRVGQAFDAAQIAEYSGGTFLLDTAVPGKVGGTGVTFDWQIARRAKQYGRLILAGGINEFNVARAVMEVQPFAIDVNSGVETAPGIKDGEKIKRLFAAIPRGISDSSTIPMF